MLGTVGRNSNMVRVVKCNNFSIITRPRGWAPYEYDVCVPLCRCSHGDLNSISNSLKTIGQSVSGLVDELILENNLLPSLPGQMFSSVRILRLMLRENALQRVSANWLAGTENTLQEIYIVEPELRSFPDDGVVTLPKLEALTLSAGLLAKMPAIFGLSRLRFVSRSCNRSSSPLLN